MVLYLAMFHPRREVPHLPVVSVVREPHLWANVQDLASVDNDSTVVDDVLMNDRPAGARHLTIEVP